MEDDRPLTAKEKRQEQIKRWQNSATDLECGTYSNPKTRVKFDDGAVFLAACSSGDLDEVGSLIKNGADINFANVDGLTALHQACIDGILEVVEFLVEHGSEIDHEDNEGWTPLHATASCGFMDIAKYLVKKGANVGAVNSEAELPIDIAEEDEMVEYLQSEIDNQGIDVDKARDIERLVMLKDANTLLDKFQNGEKLEIYKHHKSGATCLHITAAKGYNDVLKILIKAGLDVNLRDYDGWTPLHAASHWSQETSAKILADKNADFRARSKLGQTPFDVADEDMLEYLRELETEQKENELNVEESPVIEPPPLKSEKSTSIKDITDNIKINEIQNGEKRRKKVIEDSPESSSEESVSPSALITSLPPRSPASDAKTSISSRQKDRTSSLTNENSSEDVSGSYSQRRNARPASLHISSTQEKPPHRPLSMAYSEGGSKPVAATQSVQSVQGKSSRENGNRTPTYPKDVNEDSSTPSSWRTGLKKAGSFDDKSKLSSQKSEIERSSSYSSRFSDENKQTENTKLARVAPILDARKTKSEAETDESVSNDTSSGYQGVSYRRKFGTETSTTSTPKSLKVDTSTDTSAIFKRSSITESTTETPTTTTSANDTATAIKTAADHRRSHLQPVRDEEAEAQRRIRSRRERQSRRSTQGVTLDVYEEAMRTIGQMKRPSAEKTNTEASTDSRQNESTSSSLRRGVEDNQPTSSSTSSSSAQPGYYSSTNTSVGTPVTSLPSGYIPSDRRVKVNDSTPTNTKPSGISVLPSITVENIPSEGENDKEISEENGNSAIANRKSAAQQRRRNRKERRSTGLPDLKPASSATENNEVEEDDLSLKDDTVDTAKAERLRMKYDSSSLPNRHERHRAGVRGSDSDIPSRLTQSQTGEDSYSSARNRITDTKNYKKLYDENQVENERLRNELAEAQNKVRELEARLEKAEENSVRKQALDKEKRERRALEDKVDKMEKELQNSDSAEKIRAANGQLKAENTALHRIVEKLGGGMPDSVMRIIDDTPAINNSSLLSPKKSDMKSESAPDLRKLEQASEEKEKPALRRTGSPAFIRRSSSSSSLSQDEEVPEVRRKSSASLQGSEAVSGSYTSSRPDSPSSNYSGSSYSSLRRKARLESSTSSPSLLSRTASPRRPAASNYTSVSDYGRSSSFTPSRYTPSRREPSAATSYTIPISASRREFLKTLPSSTSTSSHRTTPSSLRTTPTPYGSSSSYSKPSYGSSTSSRPRHGYSSTTGRSDLSKYSTGLSGLSSSRRHKY